ncbi:MAG: class I SAM-dependent methyltransferase, partial [Acidobacteriota bacterium]|nr:class I SAM-dependent methyltransferase [Acidobacteriota bacterium]
RQLRETGPNAPPSRQEFERISMEQVVTNSTPDYRFNIPWQVNAGLLLGTICVAFSMSLLLRRKFFVGGVLFVLAALIGAFRIMIFLITDPKRRRAACNRMVNSIQWTGAEQVLDVGCGNGLVLFAAAKRLKDGVGKAVGIDIWMEMAGRQNAETLMRNAEIEGVANRVELREADAHQLPFSDASFDVVFASLSLHHAGDKTTRRQVVSEMKRVLKPGGTIVIYDLFAITSSVAQVLRELGMNNIQHLNTSLLRILRALDTV